jgi:DNA-binding response OmpR family regulator
MTTHNDPLIRSGRPTLLLAEDDPDQSEMLTDILSDEGFTVDAAFSGEAAWHKLNSRRYALAILDIRMPGLNGCDVLRRLRANENGYRTPAIVVSAFATEPEMRKYRAEGADAAFSKPYDVADLLAIISTLSAVQKGDATCKH